MLLPLSIASTNAVTLVFLLFYLAVADVHVVIGVRVLSLVHAVAGTFAVVDVSSVIGPTVTGIHANAL